MSELNQLEQLLDQTIARRRQLAGWSTFWRYLILASGLYLAVLLLFKLAPVPWTLVKWTGLLTLASVPLGFAWGWFRRMGRADAARFLDARAGLQERLSTAWEVSTRPDKADSESQKRWRELVLTDAATASGQVHPQRLMPVSLPPSARWAALILALAAGLGFVPEYRSRAQQEAAALKTVIQDAGRGVVQFTKRELTERKPVIESTKKAIEDVGTLGERLQTAKLTREDALKDLTKATDALRQQTQDLTKKPAFQQLERAARQSGSSLNQTAEQLQKQIDQLQKELGKNGKDASEAVRELQKDLQKLKDAAKGLASKAGEEAKSARAEMSKALSELAQKAMDQGLPMDGLREAADQLKAANIEQFLKNLEFAQLDLEKLAETARQLQQLQQQSEKIGKDLEEQLRNGQAQAAQQTLQKMMDQIQKPDVNQEQLAKIAQECQNGAKPGEKLGKVGEHLKKAAEQAKKGDKAGSQKSMAAAKKELDDLMNQMGDAQQMLAAMQALQKAQLCIANGQCWGEGQGQGQGKSGGSAGKNGPKRGRRGFGDWSNDNPWNLPEEIADSWDNSGMTRADKAAKGNTDREAGTPDNLAPTKIKGQFQPGGPMPSITLKGVSIKGDSKVAYTEAVTAAQSDAQAALSQDQVPKAYKNAVRDYFDDLK